MGDHLDAEGHWQKAGMALEAIQIWTRRQRLAARHHGIDLTLVEKPVQNPVIQAVGGVGPGQGWIPLQGQPVDRACLLPEKQEGRQLPLHPTAPGGHPGIARQCTAVAAPELWLAPAVMARAPGGDRSAIHRYALKFQLLPGEGADRTDSQAGAQLLAELPLLTPWPMSLPASHEDQQWLRLRLIRGVEGHQPAAASQGFSYFVGPDLKGLDTGQALQRKAPDRPPTGIGTQNKWLSSRDQRLGQGADVSRITAGAVQAREGSCRPVCNPGRRRMPSRLVSTSIHNGLRQRSTMDMTGFTSPCRQSGQPPALCSPRVWPWISSNQRRLRS